MTDHGKSAMSGDSTRWGVPGGGENTRSWRHHDIVAAFESLTVTDAIAQADKFEQIARQWEDCWRAFAHAANGSLARAWTGVGAAAAGSAVDAYVAQARDLTVALEQLPEVVRAAVEAVVATRCAIPPLVVDGGASTEAATGLGAVPATGHSVEKWSPSGVLHGVGSVAEHGAASAAEETARTVMRQKYVTPFGELIDRIPQLPTPTRYRGAVSESGDRRSLVDGLGALPGERRGRTAVGAARADASDQDCGEAGQGGGGSRLTSAEPDVDVSAAGAGAPGGATGAPGSAAGAASTATETPGDATGASGSATAAAGNAGNAAAVSTSSVGGAGAVAQRDTGFTVPGAACGAVRGGSGPLTPPRANFAVAVEPAMSAGRNSPTSPLAGGSWPAAGTDSGDRALGGLRDQQDAQRPKAGQSVPGATGTVIGSDPTAGRTPTRSVDRYFHCAGAAQASPATAEGAVRGLPEYLINLANTRELLGVPRPAIAGGVIGGDELVSDEQRSSATRG